MTERPLSDRDYRALARFRHALRIFLHFSEEAARAEGLTPSQHQLLLAIRGHPVTPSVADLADVLRRLSSRHRAELRGFRDEMADLLRELDDVEA